MTTTTVEPVAHEEGRNVTRARVRHVVRFSVGQRVEHVLLMVSFIVLMATGLPQHFHEAGWARWLILGFGGIELTRFVHRLFALVLIIEAAYHVVSVSYAIFFKHAGISMVPTPGDARDAVQMIRYSFGLTDVKPRYGRFSYRQKFEYWGVIFGTVIMITTGLVLAFPTVFTRFLPGQFVPAAKEVHGWEALLALSIIVIWHLYGTHLAPGKFPFDRSIFTGKISVEELRLDHAKEFELVSIEGETPAVKASTGAVQEPAGHAGVAD